MYESISNNNELENEMTLDMSYFWYSDKAKCRACNIMVKHHKKSEKVKSHLNCCAPFKAIMKDLKIRITSKKM